MALLLHEECSDRFMRSHGDECNMFLYQAAGEIVRAAQILSAGKTPRAARAWMRQRPGQWGNVSKNSGKRLPDSFSSIDFRMYSWATVITL